MDFNLIINQLLSLSLTLFPTSYILIMYFSRILNKRTYQLGETTAICTNITGILSRRNPIVSLVHFDEFQLQTSEEKHANKELLSTNPSIELISAITSFCHFPKQKVLEESIQHFIKSYGHKPQEIKDSFRLITEIPEYPEKKTTTAVVIKKDTEDIFSLCKGNIKTIIERCTKEIVDNKKINLTPEKKRAIKRRIEKLSKQGRKLIGFAYKGLPKKILNNYTEEFTENDLTFIGFIGLNDEINTSLKEDIEKTKQANIKIYITSSLKEKKARHAALELKIINPAYFETLNGATIADMDDKKFQKVISNREKDFIFCELTNQDKTNITKQLEAIGEKVTTLNPNENLGFKQILESVKTTQENQNKEKKLKNHSLNCKIAEAMIVLTAIAFGNPTPLSLIMLIIIDIIINVILELAIRENNDVENQKFRPTTGIFMGLSLIAIYIINLLRFGWTPSYHLNINPETYSKSATMIIISIIIFQVISAYTSINKPFKNLYLQLSTIICMLFIYIITTIPFAQKVFNLGPLEPIEWQITAYTIVVVFAFEEISKYVNRHKKNANTNS